MRCKTCGNEMIGDGYKTIVHCENVDIFEACAEPDANALHCKTEGPESTEDHRVWHSGPPPHVGWWQAGWLCSDVWRWWDGRTWSKCVIDTDSPEHAADMASQEFRHKTPIQWNDYWPVGARVPRLAPEDFEIGARWTVVSPQFPGEFVGMELRVHRVTEHVVTWVSDQFLTCVSFVLLPSEHYVPSRCVGPQTRWDFPVAKGCDCKSPDACRVFSKCQKGHYHG